MKTNAVNIVGWVVFILIVAVVVIMAIVSSQQSAQQLNEALKLDATDITYGNQDASVVVIEYSDIQCPACAYTNEALKVIKEEYKDRVLFVFRHFPLTSIHPNALAGSYAVEAAHAQGKFWEMHDLLFASQAEWSNLASPQAKFIEYADTLEMDTEKFATDMAAEATLKNVADDMNVGIDLGINSTPTFFINGEKVSNPGTVEAFRSVLNARLGN